jgi:hypothetical protein
MTDPSKLSDLLAPFEAQLLEAYRRGHRDGCAETRERILKAVDTADAGLADEDEAPSDGPNRVERGTVRKAVQQVVSEHPGLTVAEIGRRATQIDERIAISSVANELRRNKGKLYRRRSGRWYAMEEESDRETAGIAGGDHPPYRNGAEASG